jgi:hypothetical protein
MPKIEIEELLKQATAMSQQFETKMEQVRRDAAARVVVAEAGGGMVRATADGSMRIRRIEIEPALLSAGDKPMLEDLIVVAVNDAIARAEQANAEEMSKLGPLAGLKLPNFGGDK